MHRPAALWLLLFALMLLGHGGLYGGVAMLADPSGHLIQMSEVLPVPDFILPGLFLVLVMGLAPLFLVYALFACPPWLFAQTLCRRTGTHWAWSATLVLTVVLLLWLAVQGIFIGFKWPMQYVTASLGVSILLLASAPAVRRFSASSDG